MILAILDSENHTRGTFAAPNGLHQVSLSPDARWLLLKGQLGMRLFDVASKQVLWDHDVNWDMHTARSRIKWTPHGTRGATAGNASVYVWNLRGEKWIARFPHGHTGFWPDVARSPDGQSMAASDADSNFVTVWEGIDALLKQ